jgi:hypothetical protein
MNKIMERWQVLLSESSNLSQDNKDILDMLQVLDFLDETQDDGMDNTETNSFSLESSSYDEEGEESLKPNSEIDASSNTNGESNEKGNDNLENAEDKDVSNNKKGHSNYGTKISANLWLKKIIDIFPENMTLRIIDEFVKRDLPIALPEEIINKVEVNQNNILNIIEYAKNHRNNEVVKNMLIKKIDYFIDQMIHIFKKEITNSIGEKNSEYIINRLRSKRIAVKKTIVDNLKNYDLENESITIEKIWYKNYLDYFNDHHMIIAIDQSGSMTETNLYATLIGGTFASVNNIKTTLIKFDTEVYDFSEMLDDVVSIIFDTFLGGGTDIHKALVYSHKLISEPNKTVFILMSDLEDNMEYTPLIKDMIESKVTVIVIPGITDNHSISYNRQNAKVLSKLGCHLVEGNPEEVMRCIMNII